MKCKKCGSEEGYYSNIKGTQFYTFEGEVDGYVINSCGTKSLWCKKCGWKITLETILKHKNKQEKDDEGF